MSSRIRVAAVTHLYPTDAEPAKGAAILQRFQEFAKYADVTVFCVMPDYPDFRFLQPRTFQHKRATRIYSAPPVDGTIVRYPALPWLSRPLNGRACGNRLLPHLRKARPDIVLSTFLYPDGYAAVRCGRELGIPVIVEAIGSDLKRVKGYWARRWTRETVQNANYLTTVSADLRRRAIEEFGAPADRVQVIQGGCDPAIFRLSSRAYARQSLGVAADAELIVFAGRLVEIKGLRELFSALPGLIARRPRAQLACVGEGPLLPALRAAAERGGIEKSVRFAGALPPGGVAQWMTASNLVCLPSYSEGTPGVVIEALACGRPVVASRVGGIPELIGPACGILVPPKDAKRLAEGLEQALARDWNESLIAASFQRSSKDSAQEYFDLCLKVLQRSAASQPVSAYA
jgi:glycosyltransferase involved in cell wall biosynthesis